MTQSNFTIAEVNSSAYSQETKSIQSLPQNSSRQPSIAKIERKNKGKVKRMSQCVDQGSSPASASLVDSNKKWSPGLRVEITHNVTVNCEASPFLESRASPTDFL